MMPGPPDWTFGNMNDEKPAKAGQQGATQGVGTAMPHGNLTACRLTSLPAPLLAEMEFLGRESLGRSAPNRWMLPVIASWGLFYVAKVDSEVIGSAQIIRCLERGDLYMDAFYIRPFYRRAGYGKAFLVELTKQLGKLGFKRLLATMDPGKRAAVRLYAGAGFDVIDNLPDYYGQGRHRFLIAASLVVI